MPETGRDTVWTIGHSTHSIEAFLDMLLTHAVGALVDVRTIPKSRHNPQFAADALAASLAGQGIEYSHSPGLGGMRRPRPDSPNGAWRNTSFRGYADHMRTDAFTDAVADLTRRASRVPTVIMCAEAVPWRCHRSMIGDALIVRGFRVTDVLSATSSRPHALTPFARVHGTSITYPPAD